MKQLTINGEAKEFPDNDFPSDIISLLEKYDIAADSVIVEIDGELASADNFSTVKLKENSRVELIRYVGGG